MLHAGLLIFGIALLVKAARFRVEAGKTSTEMVLITETVAVTAPAPPKTEPPRVVPTPPPVPVPEPIKAVIPTPVKPTVTALTPSIVPTIKLQPAKPSIKPKAVVAKTQPSSMPFRGATEAQPDELHNEPPVYPEESRVAGEQGVVLLRVNVTAAGEASGVTILKSSGYFRLDQAARQAVQLWKFDPALRAGLPVSSEAEVPVHFQLQ